VREVLVRDLGEETVADDDESSRTGHGGTVAVTQLATTPLYDARRRKS
jgi:hypothetical protein